MLILMLRTLMVYLLILLAMRLMGKRQLGELQPAELVSTILISNLASISIESPELPLPLRAVFLPAQSSTIAVRLPCYRDSRRKDLPRNSAIAAVRDRGSSGSLAR